MTVVTPGALNVECSEEQVLNSFNGKMQGAYVAQIKGPGTGRWPLERGFLRVKPKDGAATLPEREAVFEVRDFVGGEKRVRYFQVHGREQRLLTTLDDQEVLDAVEASQRGEWWEGAAQAQGETVYPEEVLMELDEVTETLVGMLPDLDEEDLRMELDRVRKRMEVWIGGKEDV